MDGETRTWMDALLDDLDRGEPKESTTTASTRKETLYVQEELDYYTKKEEQEWRKALLDFLSLPNFGITTGEHKLREDARQQLWRLTRFLSDK